MLYYKLPYECEYCGKSFNISGEICEYPVGAYNYEDIHVEKAEDEDENEK